MFNTINFIYNKWVKESVFYMFDSKTREAKNVSKFLAEQLDTYSDILEDIVEDNDWKKYNNDTKITMIQTWVINNIDYISDRRQYKKVEYWANVFETLMSGKGDCEDGAILLFCLARKAGIPKEQIDLVAGDVSSGGHSWVRYVSTHYPYGSFFIDWCYWMDVREVNRGKTFYFDFDEKIKPNNKYKSYWFLCDETKGTRKFKW